MKYRTEEITPIEIDLTWGNSTAFTTSTDLTSYIGYEVEILNGSGSGLCGHITQAILQDGLYHVVIDNPFTGFTSTAKARVSNWTKMTKEITGQSMDFEELSIIGLGAKHWIQFKIWMLNKGDDELNEIVIINNTNQK